MQDQKNFSLLNSYRIFTAFGLAALVSFTVGCTGDFKIFPGNSSNNSNGNNGNDSGQSTPCTGDYVQAGAACVHICQAAPDSSAAPFQAILNKDNINYYVVCNNEQFNAIGTQSEYLSKNFILKADLSFDATSTAESNFTPIGSDRNASALQEYSGIFNGDGHVVSGLVFKKLASDVALFRRTNGATIKNLRVSQVNFKGINSVGGLVGFATGTTIINSESTGSTIQATDASGGLVGSALNSHILKSHSQDSHIKATHAGGALAGYSESSEISESFGSNEVSATFRVGGLLGVAVNSSITKSFGSGTIAGTSEVGGLIGIASASTVALSYAAAAVGGTSEVGGLVGYIKKGSQVSQSYASGAVTGVGQVGGLLGNVDSSSVTNTYATATVYGTGNAGGLIGVVQSSSISNSYTTGSVDGTSSINGFIGQQLDTKSTFTELYMDMETSGHSSDATSAAKTTGEMKTSSTYSKWDQSIWTIVDGQYPQLKNVIPGLSLKKN